MDDNQYLSVVVTIRCGSDYIWIELSAENKLHPPLRRAFSSWWPAARRPWLASLGPVHVHTNERFQRKEPGGPAGSCQKEGLTKEYLLS